MLLVCCNTLPLQSTNPRHLSVYWFLVVSVVLCRALAVSLSCSRCFGVDWVLFFEVRCFVVDLCCSSMARGGSCDSCLFLRCLAVSWSCFGISCSQWPWFLFLEHLRLLLCFSYGWFSDLLATTSPQFSLFSVSFSASLRLLFVVLSIFQVTVIYCCDYLHVWWGLCWRKLERFVDLSWLGTCTCIVQRGSLMYWSGVVLDSWSCQWGESPFKARCNYHRDPPNMVLSNILHIYAKSSST